MNAYDVARRIAGCFDEDQVPYGIGGAIALGAWGVPRATKDVDISAFVSSDDLPRVLDSLERAGVLVRRDEAARDVARIGLFKGRLGAIVVDVFVSDHPQYAAMKQRVRRIADPDGNAMDYITAEDLCIHKLLFGRPRDVSDLEQLAAVRTLDLAYVRSWLVQMIPEGDRRFAILDDLERRFAT
jgi:hypothetical protein